MGDQGPDRTSDDPGTTDDPGATHAPSADHDRPMTDGSGAADATLGDEEADEVPGDGGAGHLLADEVEYPENAAGSALPPRVEKWRRRSATGAMLTGFAFGLRETFEPTFNEPAVVLETSGVPPKDLAVEADLDNVPPRQSVVRIRRWLLTDTPGGADAASGAVDHAVASDETRAGDNASPDGPADEGAPDDGGGVAGAERSTRVTEIRDRTTTRKRTRRFGRDAGRRS